MPGPYEMPNQSQLSDAGASRRFLPLLLLLFAGSGCSALIYEIVWYQLLQLVIGSTAVSLAVLLATFMGGLCLGSMALPRIRALGGRHPLRVYALVELGIGICGILVLFGMPLVDRVYVAAVGHGLPAVLLRAVVAAACLLPPTVLMGASLPAASRWLETTPEGVSWMGLLYGGNTAGAVFGCLLAGFYLLRVHDMATATLVAAALNGAVALVSFGMAARTPHQVGSEEEPAATPAVEAAPGSWPIYVTIALSGACALGAEVVWTRLLGLLLGATVYTFSIILAVFLAGLGMGSAVAAALVRGIARPRMAIGRCQLLLAGAVAWTAYMLANSLPYWPINPLLSTSPWYTFQIDLARSIWAILPAALLWGASFPLALAAVASRGRDAGRMVGGIYAANTAGAIVGALVFSMLLIPSIGTQGCERVLIVLSAVSALFALAPLEWPPRLKACVLVLAATVATVFLAMSVSGVPSMLIAYGRRITISANSSQILYAGEGMNSSIAISRWNDGAVQFHVSGKVEASTEPYDMRLQRMLGHMPALLLANPRSVLVVGFGAGVTAGSFVLHPEVKRIVICEMERMIPPVATRYFAKENNNVLNDPRVEMVYDDARHYILTTREKFDVITSDPIHPWVKGSATLYSKEYFELVKRHLNPGGIVTQWVPLYESDLSTVKSELATFFDVFPAGTIWGNDNAGGGYDTVLLGQAEPTRINVDQLQEKLDRPDEARVAQSMREVGFNSAIALLSTYAGQASDLRSWLVDAGINRDGNLRLQYLAGLALNNSMEGAIYSQMLTYRRYPENLFVVSDQGRQSLMMALSQ
jgi:spermidine synthase